MIVVGIDPGTGSKSPTGLVCFDTETKAIHYAVDVGTTYEETDLRIAHIAAQVTGFIVPNEDLDDSNVPDLVCIETFVMQGKGGQTLHHLIGAFIGMLALKTTVRHIFNTTVKKLIGGMGSSDKLAVAHGVLHWFRANDKSREMLRRKFENEEWDIFDALAIGIAGHEMYLEEIKNG